MSGRAYRAVLFDLFDTLVRFDRERLPAVPLNGRVVRSTVGELHPILAAWAPQVTLEALYNALLESWQQAERLRAVALLGVDTDDRGHPQPAQLDPVAHGYVLPGRR